MEQQIVINELNALVRESRDKIIPTKWRSGALGARDRVNASLYSAWYAKALSFIRMVLPENNDFLEKFSSLDDHLYNNAESCIGILENIVEYIEKGFLTIHDEFSIDVEEELRRIFSRFNKVVRQLRNRYDDRPTLEVEDEYDVQDLLHALLRLYFDDVRAEEWTPSYAGKSARVDFLLKNEKIVIEVKKTRRGLTDKELGDQLIVDVDRYKIHPDCERLICFIYDPEERIGNPIGLMSDLNGQHAGFAEVIIEPLK